MSLALANPDMPPKHPGYPMGKAVDPVKGQPLANDPGQTNASDENALVESSAFDNAHSAQHLSINQNGQRVLEKPRSGNSSNGSGTEHQNRTACEGGYQDQCVPSVTSDYDEQIGIDRTLVPIETRGPHPIEIVNLSGFSQHTERHHGRGT